jgi:hypothetical protein
MQKPFGIDIVSFCTIQRACRILRSRKPKDKEAAPSGLFYFKAIPSLGAYGHASPNDTAWRQGDLD